jgi:hypothetical protein
MASLEALSRVLRQSEEDIIITLGMKMKMAKSGTRDSTYMVAS